MDSHAASIRRLSAGASLLYRSPGMTRPEGVLACLLPFGFEVAPIEAELDALRGAPWSRHFNERVYEGAWTGLALRAPGGDASRIYPDLTESRPVADTGLLARLPATRDLLDRLPFEKRAVRFLRLAPGARIHPHRDYDLGLDQGEVRLHAVVRTHPDVRFVVGGVRLVMQPGELWYADFHEPHSVDNEGPGDRVHLVVDCVVDDALRDAIARSPASIPRTSAS